VGPSSLCIALQGCVPAGLQSSAGAGYSGARSRRWNKREQLHGSCGAVAWTVFTLGSLLRHAGAQDNGGCCCIAELHPAGLLSNAGAGSSRRVAEQRRGWVIVRVNVSGRRGPQRLQLVVGKGTRMLRKELVGLLACGSAACCVQRLQVPALLAQVGTSMMVLIAQNAWNGTECWLSW
jgi:hypothetical protein